MDEYTKRTDLDLGSDVLQKYPYAITSLPSVPRFMNWIGQRATSLTVLRRNLNQKSLRTSNRSSTPQGPAERQGRRIRRLLRLCQSDAFKAAFDKLNIPQETKAALWDMKFGGGRFVPPRPEDMLSSPAPKTPNPAASMPKNQHR